jgi:hypothetical protein
VTFEGWYYDPYQRHVARWFSDGWPTALVRDDNRYEGHDPAPEGPIPGPVVEVWTSELPYGEDLRRQDDARPDTAEDLARWYPDWAKTRTRHFSLRRHGKDL